MVEAVALLAFLVLAAGSLWASYIEALNAPLERAAETSVPDDGGGPMGDASGRASLFGALGGLFALATMGLGFLFVRDSSRFVRLRALRTRQRVLVRQAYRYLSARYGPPRLNT